jgi:putative transposase
LNSHFSADGPNQKWVVDITYVPTAEGWLYLAVVLDLVLAPDCRLGDERQPAPPDRSSMPCRWRLRPANRQPGLLHHSDRGSQYASDDYQALLTRREDDWQYEPQGQLL